MGSNPVEVPKFFRVNLQLLILQLPQRRSYLHLNCVEVYLVWKEVILTVGLKSVVIYHIWEFFFPKRRAHFLSEAFNKPPTFEPFTVRPLNSFQGFNVRSRFVPIPMITVVPHAR